MEIHDRFSRRAKSRLGIAGRSDASIILGGRPHRNTATLCAHRPPGSASIEWKLEKPRGHQAVRYIGRQIPATFGSGSQVAPFVVLHQKVPKRPSRPPRRLQHACGLKNQIFATHISEQRDRSAIKSLVIAHTAQELQSIGSAWSGPAPRRI